MFNLKKSLLLVSLLGLMVSVEAAKKSKESKSKESNINSSSDEKTGEPHTWFGGLLKERRANKQEKRRAERKKKRAEMTEEQKSADKSARKARREAKFANMTDSRKKSYDEKRASRKAAANKPHDPYALPEAEAAAKNAAVINARPYDPYRDETPGL